MIVVSSLVLAACGGSSAAITARSLDSGIVGQVLLGPTCPVERAGHPCVRPYRTTVAVFAARTLHRLTTFRSGADGRFRVRLAAGSYRLEGTHGGLPRLAPVLVTVRPDRFTSVTIMFDTGIR